MDKTEVVKKVHALMNDKNNYTARLQAEEVVEKYVEQRLETASVVDTIVSSSEWISVVDELPPLGEEVIVQTETKRGKGVTCLSRRISQSHVFPYVWDNDYGGGNMHLPEAVTYWMPLPKPKD
jgi:hypothetical protein